MKKHLLSLMLGLACCVQAAAARDLVVTLKDGTRYAYPLSNTAAEGVVLKRGEGTITLNGDVYVWADIRELRVYKERPEDAVPVGIRALEGQPAAPALQQSVYDLSGRRAAQTSTPQRGIYIVNQKKVAVR